MESKINKPIYKISFSEYSTYMQCQHKWFMQYQLKMFSPKNEETIIGSAIHNTIESVLVNPFVKKTCKSNPVYINTVFQNKLKEELVSINEIDMLKKIQKGKLAGVFYGQGMKLLKELNIFKRFSDYDVVDVEYKLDNFFVVESDYFVITFNGLIDLVLKHKITGRYLILDWKTSGNKWDIEKKEKNEEFYSQLKLYKIFYSKAKDIPLDDIDICFFNLPRMEAEGMDKYQTDSDDCKEYFEYFSEKCKEITDFNIFALKKAKFNTPINFCNRCFFNNNDMCNDTDEYQLVNLNK